MARILIIDDDELMRTVIRRTLEKAGHDVFEAGDGEEGLAAQRKISADLVITDIVMPVKEGIETIRALRELSPDLRIIAISGHGRFGKADYLWAARDFGADYTFEKPIEWQVLVAAVAHCVGQAA